MSKASPRDRPSEPFTDLARSLPRIVAANLTVPDQFIDDACQGAWLLFLGEDVAVGAELSWLVTTATRLVLRALHLQQRDTSYEDERDRRALADRAEACPGPEALTELRERLAVVERLPVRQRRMLLMHGLGYRYWEISASTGDSPRTVERQLLHARQRLARAA